MRRCCENWLTDGLPGRDLKTVAKNRFVVEPLLAVMCKVRLRDLDATDVDDALAAVAASRSSSTVAMAHLALTRAITRAQAKNLVLGTVSALTGTPTGRQGRPSCSMTLAQATAVTTAAKTAGPRTCVHVMLSLCTGCGPRKRGRRCGGSRSTSAIRTAGGVGVLHRRRGASGRGKRPPVVPGRVPGRGIAADWTPPGSWAHLRQP